MGAPGPCLMAEKDPTPAERSVETALADWRWARRPLLVYLPEPQSHAGTALVRKLEGRQPDLEERHMVVRLIEPDTVRSLAKLTAAGDPASWRKVFGIEPDEARVLLVGKDGGVKARAGLDVDLDAIFTQVDGMPMRQAEIRRQAEKEGGDR